MNTLIIGGSGQVGGYLRRQFEPTTNLISTYYSHKQNGLRKLDIGNKQACEDLLGYFRPSLILLPAAMTYVDGCEKEPERCFATNVNGIENIARLAKELQSRLVFFSTDYVFSGRNPEPHEEEDPTGPINAYARSKVLAENIVRKYVPLSHLIVRTAWVYGNDSQEKNFVTALCRRLHRGETIKVPADQWGSPTYAADLAQVTVHMIERCLTGTYHVVGPEWMTRYDFATAICTAYQLDKSRVKPVATEELNQAAARPRKCLLSCKKIAKALSFSMRSPAEGLIGMRNELLDVARPN